MSVSINRLIATGGSLLLFAAGCLCTMPDAVCADDYHYVNILVGDRAADMAGAYTAVSDNASGCYYNPAGIVYGAGSNLSASVNAFSVANKTYKGALTVVTPSGDKKKDWTQTSTILLPNFFGSTYATRYGTIGFSYAVPDSVQRRQKQSFSDVKTTLVGAKISDYVININDVDNTYVFGPTFAKKFGDSFSLGLTLYGTYRDATVIRNQYLHLADTDPDPLTPDYSNGFEWRNGYIYRNEIGIKPIFGMMWAPADKWVFGVTASRKYIVSSTHDTQTTINSNIGADPNAATLLKSSDDVDRELPMEAKFGIAYFASPALLLAADVTYNSASGTFTRDEQTIRYLNPANPSAGHTVLEDEMQPVINFALGAEYYFSDRYALRGGVYTDYSSTNQLAKDGATANQPEHVDLIGGTLTLTRFTRSTSTTLGLGYSSGKGEAQIVGGSTKVQDIEISNLVAFLSAAYSF